MIAHIFFRLKMYKFENTLKITKTILRKVSVKEVIKLNFVIFWKYETFLRLSLFRVRSLMNYTLLTSV